MKHLRRMIAAIRLAGLVLAIWLLPAAVALARKQAEEEAPATKSYATPYLVTILLVVLGLIVVCRPTRRWTETTRRARENDNE